MGGAEFAKALLLKGVNISPIPLKQVRTLQQFPATIAMFAKDLYRIYGETLSILDLLRLVPDNKRHKCSLLLTCPLYSYSDV